MALFKGSFFSEALGMNTDISVILPDPAIAEANEGKLYPTLYLLHGGSENFTELPTETALLSYVRNLFPDLIVVMPNAHFSFYTDYAEDYRYAYKYKTYVGVELVDMVRSLFPSSPERQDNFLYGCSMGGCGSLNIGLNQPERYSVIGLQSPMCDWQWAIDTRPFLAVKHRCMLGTHDITGTEYDFYDLTKKLNESCGPKPAIWHSWAVEDYLLEINRKFNRHMLTLENLDYTFSVVQRLHGWGDHSCGIENFLNWLSVYHKEKGVS